MRQRQERVQIPPVRMVRIIKHNGQFEYIPIPHKSKTRRLNIHINSNRMSSFLGSLVALSLWAVILLPLYFALR